MARIPTEEIERLEREVAVERLAEARGIALARKGADLVGLCPFHDDTSPSLIVTLAKDLWHCLGACQAGGSVIDWVMRAEGVSFRHALALLQADYQPSSSPAGVKRSTVPKLPTALVRDTDGVGYAQIVGATTNKENAYPEPGAAVYTVLSGAFDQVP